MVEQDALEIIRMRNNFYRDSYRRVLTGLLLMILLNIVLAVLLYYMITHRPKPEYFATTSDGKVIPMHALSDPLVTDAELAQWVTTAATSVYTYNFVNWRKELQDASDYFTPTGWREFQSELKASTNLETVTSQKLSVRAVATGAPIILDRGSINGVFKWKIQIPLLVTYESVNVNRPQPLLVNLQVTRVSTLDTPKGIQIDAYYAFERPLQQ